MAQSKMQEKMFDTQKSIINKLYSDGIDFDTAATKSEAIVDKLINSSKTLADKLAGTTTIQSPTTP